MIEPSNTKEFIKNMSEEAKKAIVDYPANDAGNAKAFLAICKDAFLYVKTHGWYFYTGTHWSRQEDQFIRKYIIDALKVRRLIASEMKGKEAIVKCSTENASTVKNCIFILESLCLTNIEGFDAVNHELNVKNGVLDLQTLTLTPHNPSQKFTYCISSRYDPSVKGTIQYKTWVNFLEKNIQGGKEVVDYVQMMMGYSITGSTDEEVLFYVYGPNGRNGKGTVFEAIEKCIGSPTFATASFSTFTSKRGQDKNNFDLARFKSSRFVLAGEGDKHDPLNPSMIKSLTGGDSVKASLKHKDEFEYKPKFKMWLVSNHMARTDITDNAAWSRIRVITFPNSYEKTKKASVKNSMKSDDNMEAVLCWIVEGAKKWYDKGDEETLIPKVVEASTQEHRDEDNSLEEWYSEECTIDEVKRSRNEGPSISDVKRSYATHCEANGKKPYHERTVGDFIKNKELEWAKPIKTKVTRKNQLIQLKQLREQNSKGYDKMLEKIIDEMIANTPEKGRTIRAVPGLVLKSMQN